MLRRLIDRLRLPFRKDRELRSALFRILGFYPQHIEYYKIAFAHKSQALRDKNGKPLNNERLEFLGDAVLESVVSDILFHHFEKRHEGFLTATRSKIVQRESLNRLAKEMGIDKLIQTSTRNHTAHSHLGGNAFEALMGAIYLDKGYKTCQKFVQKQILGRLMDLDGVANKEVNFKSKLLEWCQKNKLKQDFVMRLEDNDKQKEPLFHCTVVIEAIEFGYGKGYSKKEAQQQAARETLTMLRRDENVVDSVFRSKEKRTAMEANEMAVLPKIDEIENDLLLEQQQPLKNKVLNVERKSQKAENKQPVAVKEPTEKKQQKPTEEQMVKASKKDGREKQDAQVATTKETATSKKPVDNKPQASEDAPSTPAPQKQKKEKKAPKDMPINVATLAEAAIAEAEELTAEVLTTEALTTDFKEQEKPSAKKSHLPSLVESHSTAVATTEPHSTAVVVTEQHSTAVTTVEPPHKHEVVVVTSNEQGASGKAKQVVATPEVPNATPETQEGEPAKKEKRKRHKVTRIAEYTQTEVKSQEEVEAERQRISEEREEKRRSKRVKREAYRAKEDLEKLTQPEAAPAENEILAEVSLEEEQVVSKPTPPQEATNAPLSNSAKRRLRRKRAAERAQQEQVATTTDSAEVVQTTGTEPQHAEENVAAPTERKKHQRGNSRKRRRQQTAEANENVATPTEA